MNVDRSSGQPGVTPPLPSSIWVVAWASLAGQVLLLARQGLRLDDEASLALSLLLGPLLVGYVSAGVVRVRTVRLALAWIVLVLSAIGELVGFVAADAGDVALLASFVTSVVAIAGLASFSRTEWFAWQRTKPSPREGASIGPLVAIAVLVGVLGAVAGPLDDGVQVDVRVSPR